MQIALLGLDDFHGNLLAPGLSVNAADAGEAPRPVAAEGAAPLAALVAAERAGHTHRAYLCDYAHIDPAKPLLPTSAGLHGTLLTELELTVDTGSRRVIQRTARQPIVPDQDYRIGVQSYLAIGGDNFGVFTQGRDPVGGGLDADALSDYLRGRSRQAPMVLPLQPRISLSGS